MKYVERVIDPTKPYGEVCPVCGGEIVARCKCSDAHSVCENDHKWHYVGLSIVIDKG
jgi:hypothetical protein